MTPKSLYTHVVMGKPTGRPNGRPAAFERSQVGARIVAAREAAGMTQQQLADKIGVSLTNIAFWERRAPAPRAEMLAKVADVLGVSADELLGRTTTAATAKKKGGPNGKVRQVFEEVSTLPRAQQQRIVGIVQDLLKAQRINGQSNS